MTVPLSYPRFKAFDTNGNPLAGGKLYSYQAGTSTLSPTYSNPALTSVNPNPVLLNPEGEAVVYLPTLTKLILKTIDDVTLWTMDNVITSDSPFYDVKDYGATGDGITDDSNAIIAAINAAFAAGGGTVYLSAGTYITTVNISVSANTNLKVDHGAVISIATGTTLTILGSFEAGLYQCFSCAGTGAVVFASGSCPYVCPEWWYSGSGSYHTALAAAYSAFTGTVTLDTGYTAGIVSMMLSKVYTVTNSPFTITTLKAGQIFGVGRGVSGIYQSGTGDAISIQTGPYNAHLLMRDFTVKGNALSGCGVSTNGAILQLRNMDLIYHGSHGFYASTNGWECSFDNVNSNYNGGDGFRFADVGDNVYITRGQAQHNGGWGINLSVTSLSKATLIMGMTVTYNAGGGIFARYCQGNFNSINFEGNTGKQLSLFDAYAGSVQGCSFFDNTAVATHGVYIDSDFAAGVYTNLTVASNIFQGVTVNVWQSGNANGCVIGPNKAIDGTNQIFGTSNLIVDQAGRIESYYATYSGITPVGNVTPTYIGEELLLNFVGNYSWWRAYGLVNTNWLKLSP